jgi:hypothetical protein
MHLFVVAEVPKLFIFLLACEIVFMVVATLLWVAAGFQVGLQGSELQPLI